jgi:sugar phosphate permease
VPALAPENPAPLAVRTLLPSKVLLRGIFCSLNSSSPVTYGSTVTQWFDKHRGLALAIMMLGIGIGATVMPSLARRLIVHFGWRSAFAWYGCAVLVIAVPVVGAFLKDSPAQIGLLGPMPDSPNYPQRRDH